MVMFAVYALHANIDDPLSALRLGEQPEPDVREGWVRVKLSHATLNRHDLFTLRGITSHREIISPVSIYRGRGGSRPAGTFFASFWSRIRQRRATSEATGFCS